MKRSYILLVVLLLSACETATETSRETESPESVTAKTPCERAWDKALAVNEFQRSAKVYRDTFTACENVAEWQAQNKAHDDELGNSTTAIDNFGVDPVRRTA